MILTKKREKIEKEEMNGQMFRSKIKWTDEGENKLKIYFIFRKTKLYKQTYIYTRN